MTVIAYKDGILAADTASWHGNLKTGTAHKIYLINSSDPRLDGAVAAFAGWSPQVQRAIGWLSAGCQEGEMEPADQGDLQGIVVTRERVLYSLPHNFQLHQLDRQDMAAIGAHPEFLWGAMLAGASAEEAVRLAIQHCASAGGEVQVATVG